MHIQVIRSDRRTVSLEIKRDLSVAVRAPRSMTDAAIEAFVRSKEAWLSKHLLLARQWAAQAKLEATVPRFTAQELACTVKKAQTELPPRVRFWAEQMGVSYAKITVRKQISRWGSCSSQGHLSFNCLLMLCPDAVVDYVIIHELCHRKEMNHSTRFWRQVAVHCPDHLQQRAWLRQEGSALICRLRRTLFCTEDTELGG